MGQNTQWATRLPDDMTEQLEAYRQARGISKSEATRRAVAAGLDELPDVRETDSDDDADEMKTSRAAQSLTGLAVVVTAVSAFLSGSAVYIGPPILQQATLAVVAGAVTGAVVAAPFVYFRGE